MGVYKNTYSRWERGEREPSASDLIHLCREGWNINWLLTGKGPERIDAEKQGSSGAKLDPEMMQKAVESAIGVFQRFNKLPSANQLARASVLLYLLFTDNEPETAQPVDQLLARIMGEPVNADMPEPSNFPGFKGF
ncbi:helix-turn-helix domain-containing protein [Solilutibacter oculi]|nr:helix-turn-helix transcriptional regulator [Lysobacter oculi]